MKNKEQIIKEKVEELRKVLMLREETASGEDDVGLVQNALLYMYDQGVLAGKEETLNEMHILCDKWESQEALDLLNILKKKLNSSTNTSTL